MTPHRLHRLVLAVLVALLAFPAYSCGPDWAEAVFVKKHGPDTPYNYFARGSLGVVQPGYRTRHLVIAYRYLNHLPLSVEEQQSALKANELFNSTWDTDQQHPNLQHGGFLAWIEVRKALGSVDDFLPTNPFGTDNGWQFNFYFENCLDDAFANAARTLLARQSAYGGRSADVVEWARGQDAVFRNCDKNNAPPMPLPDSAAKWLRDDRAYQQAAALFYERKYDDALSALSAIAADTSSPWSAISRYMVGRAMVTRAVDLEVYYPPFGSDPSKELPPDQRRARYLDLLHIARTELLAMRAEARMQPLAHAIDAMVDRVNSRLEPELQARVLSARLTETIPDKNFYQDVLDLSYLLSDDSDVNDSALTKRPQILLPAPGNEPERRGAEMLTWMKALRASDGTASLERWRASHSTAWLLNALTFAKPEDASTQELLNAAAAVGRDDPAYIAVTYHRFRLLPATPSARNELLKVLPQLTNSESISTRNLFAELDARSAPDLNAWLKPAARKPAAEATGSEEDDFDTKPSSQPCGPARRDADTSLFASDAATILNTRLPLRLLAQAAEGTVLPPNLRYQVAQATWTRAVLLDRRDLAAHMSPILGQCNAKWQPVLSAYDHAKSDKEKKAAALFALMRFASTEPNVREGNYRVDGFAKYSYYRDNWWCFTVPPNARSKNTSTAQYDEDTGWGFTSMAHPEVADPEFLTVADRAEAAQEIAALRLVPRASAYLPTEALSWQRTHPRDPRAPELLGEAFRVARNACSGKTSSNLEHELFNTLHREYPTNHWTKRYRSWE